MKCPRCRRENPVGQKFCGECGTPLWRVGGGAEPAPSYGEVQRALTESVARESAADEILRVISGSPSEVQPVVDAIVESAARLTGAVDVVMRPCVGQLAPDGREYSMRSSSCQGACASSLV